VFVANAKLRNVPVVAGKDWPLRTPGTTRPEHYFFALLVNPARARGSGLGGSVL
jgi:hypothetical protein